MMVNVPVMVSMLLPSIVCAQGTLIHASDEGTIEQFKETPFSASSTPITRCSIPLDHAVPASVKDDKGAVITNIEWKLEALTKSIPTLTTSTGLINVGQIKFRQAGCTSPCPWINSYNMRVTYDGVAQLTWGSISPVYKYEACVENVKVAFSLRFNVKWHQK